MAFYLTPPLLPSAENVISKAVLGLFWESSLVLVVEFTHKRLESARDWLSSYKSIWSHCLSLPFPPGWSQCAAHGHHSSGGSPSPKGDHDYRMRVPRFINTGSCHSN